MPNEAVPHEELVRALREALTADTPDSPLLIKRIPGLCNDMREMRIDMRWVRWLVSVAAVVLISFLGWMSMQLIANSNRISALQATVNILTKTK